MKQNKKGFTLIELLAVIVILAIIALIATPIILNMINDARKSAAKDSAYGYIDAVEKYVTLASMGEVSTEYDSAVLPTGYSTASGATVTCTEACATSSDTFLSAVNATVKGTKPDKVTLVFANGNLTTGTTFTYGDYTLTYNGTELSFS